MLLILMNMGFAASGTTPAASNVVISTPVPFKEQDGGSNHYSYKEHEERLRKQIIDEDEALLNIIQAAMKFMN